MLYLLWPCSWWWVVLFMLDNFKGICSRFMRQPLDYWSKPTTTKSTTWCVRATETDRCDYLCSEITFSGNIFRNKCSIAFNFSQDLAGHASLTYRQIYPAFVHPWAGSTFSENGMCTDFCGKLQDWHCTRQYWTSLRWNSVEDTDTILFLCL